MLLGESTRKLLQKKGGEVEGREREEKEREKRKEKGEEKKREENRTEKKREREKRSEENRQLNETTFSTSIKTPFGFYCICNSAIGEVLIKKA